jgi:hypothetical protein
MPLVLRSTSKFTSMPAATQTTSWWKSGLAYTAIILGALTILSGIALLIFHLGTLAAALMITSGIVGLLAGGKYMQSMASPNRPRNSTHLTPRSPTVVPLTHIYVISSLSPHQTNNPAPTRHIATSSAAKHPTQNNDYTNPTRRYQAIQEISILMKSLEDKIGAHNGINHWNKFVADGALLAYNKPFISQYWYNKLSERVNDFAIEIKQLFSKIDTLIKAHNKKVNDFGSFFFTETVREVVREAKIDKEVADEQTAREEKTKNAFLTR